MATGFATEIDLSKLDKMINKLETNLQRFVDKSKDAQTQVVDAFTKMGTNGVNKFVSQLSGAINQVMEIGKKGSAIKWDSQNLNRYIDQVNQLIKLVQQVGGAGFTLPTANLNKQFASISRLKDDLKVVNELLNKGEKTGTDSNGNAIYRQLTAAEQNYFVELKKNIQEQLKFQQQSIQERLASVKKALQEELKETQETEKKKTQARNQSYKGAIKYSDKANSLEQERKAIKNLEAARESLKKTDADYSAKLEELNRRINAHRINVEAATKTEAQRNALTSSTRAEYARLLAEQDKLRQSYDKLKQSQVALGNTPETTAALQNIVKRYRDVYAEIQRYKQSANGQLDATERKFLADQASAFAENERRKTEIAQQEANKRATISSAEARKVINSASGAKNVNQQIAAIQQLKNARDKLDKTDKDYKKTLEDLNKAIKKHQEEIDKARGKVDSANNSHRRLMDTAGQLQRKLALVFSVSAIQGYISKLMQIRGEFEMQQRSLQVLLQDKDEANKLWDKTVALAVRSPFRVKELVSYTRQLAAYRIETSKLHDTTKRLADVSAGLGVDMNRIILAFGQVKAANFLRGTELRQFTEAGIPMLDELAKLFSELEGRMVSAGDVFERISKRMVTFSDVEEVFTRMTNAGGVFYNMQEEQSKTLQGMISNLRDSIDLMLNDIGKANDGLLKGSVNAAKNFVENWKEVAFYMENAIKALVAWKIANVAFVIGTQKAATTTLWLNSALKANIGTSMITIQTLKWSEAALVGVTKKQWLLGKATLYLQGILRGIGKFAIKTIVPLAAIAGVIELYRHLTKASRQAKELQNALNEIYNEDISNLERQTNVFKDLVERLKKVNVGSKEHKDIISQLNSQYGEYLGFLVTEKTTYDEIATSVNSVVEALRQKTKAQTFEKSFSKILEDNLKEINTLQSDIEKKVSEIGVYRANNKPSLMPTISELDDIFDLYEQKVKKANNLINVNELFSEYYGENLQVAANVSDKFAQIGRKILQQKKEEDKLQQRLNGLYGDGVYSTQQMREEMDALNKEREQALKADKTRIGQEKIEYDYLVKKTRLEGKYQGLEKSTIDANVAKLQKTSETIRDINRRIIESTDELGAEAVDRVYITAQDASQGVNAIAESMAAGYKSMQEEITNQNALKEAGTVHDEQSLENATKMSKAYYKVLEIMGRLDLLKSKGDKKESAIKILNNRINLIKEINKEYEKLNEKFDATKAKEQVLNAYKDTFKEAFEGTGIKFSGLVIDKEKLKIEGEESGQIFSDEMVKKMNDVIASGTYIRSASDRFKDELKEDEGVVFQLYDDSTKKIISNTKEFQNAVGTVTIGWGHAIKDINEAAKYFGKTISEVEAQEIFDQDVNAHVQALNKVLDKYQDLILTQEQYDSLLNATFQGGGGMVSSAINYAMDIDKGIKHFDNLDIKLKKVGKTFEQEFGSDFIDRFKNAETATERLALALETVGLTTVASGGNIDERLYNGMKKRSQERASEFRGDLEIVKLLQKSAIDVSQIDFTNIRGVIATLKELEPIAKKEGKEAELQLSKAISKLEAEIGLDLKVKDDKALIDKIEEMFSGYEMSIELQKLNIPKDLAKQLFNVDSVDLSSIRNKISSELAKAQATGGQEDRVKELKKQLEKVEEMEDKAMQERLKKYVKYMLQAQSERVKIKIDEMNQLSEIEKLNVSELDKNIMRQGVREETQKKLDKAAWEDFKNSDMYVRIFEDLDRASSKALSAMQDKLVELRGSLSELSPENLKEIVRLEEKIAEAKIDKNPFAGLITSIKNLSYARKALNKLEEKHGFTYEEGIKTYEEQKKKIDELQLSIKKLTDEYGADSPNAVFEKEDLETLKKANKALAEILEKMGLFNSQASNASKGIEDSFSGMSDIFSQAAQSTNEIADALDKMGALGDAQKDNFETIAGIFGGMSGIMSGAEKMASGNPFAIVAGGIQALGGVASIVGEIFAIGDKKKERQIQREIKLVEDLEREYKKLEKQIDKAYEFDTLKGSYDAAQKNIDEQIASYNKMIAAEEDKKKTDKDRIKEWQQTIEDLSEQRKELLKSQVEELGGGYDYSAMTEEFVNAWLEAFKETGDGLSGLADNFEDFWQNIAIKQAVMGGASKIMQPFLDAVNKALENDFKLDDSEMANIDQLSAKAKEDMNAFLEQWYDRWGDFMTQGEQSELSGLQRGIQSVSESTAQIIEAYLNSVRFYVADSNTKLTMIANQIIGGDETANPMLSELKTQTEMIRAIRDMFSSVIRNGHPTFGGAFIKVAL